MVGISVVLWILSLEMESPLKMKILILLMKVIWGYVQEASIF